MFQHTGLCHFIRRTMMWTWMRWNISKCQRKRKKKKSQKLSGCKQIAKIVTLGWHIFANNLLLFFHKQCKTKNILDGFEQMHACVICLLPDSDLFVLYCWQCGIKVTASAYTSARLQAWNLPAAQPGQHFVHFQQNQWKRWVQKRKWPTGIWQIKQGLMTLVTD